MSNSNSDFNDAQVIKDNEILNKQRKESVKKSRNKKRFVKVPDEIVSDSNKMDLDINNEIQSECSSKSSSSFAENENHSSSSNTSSLESILTISFKLKIENTAS